MGRAPCCKKMGLKKGSWSPEEDHILINYIHKHGHSNWRALPKQAGLLRCGKSCRLRWTNYLRPDIKRGNFTQQEEETIIMLHQMLGNRWSTIAAKLPGRTDNEIKNVWHTYLKKRLALQPYNPVNHGSTTTTTTTTTMSLDTTFSALAKAINVAAGPTRKQSRKANGSKKSGVPKKLVSTHENSMEPSDNERTNINNNNNVKAKPTSSIEPCTSEVSMVTSNSNTNTSISGRENVGGNNPDYVEDLADVNDVFWKEVLSVEDTTMSTQDLPGIFESEDWILATKRVLESEYSNGDQCEVLDVFWFNLLTKSHELPEMLRWCKD